MKKSILVLEILSIVCLVILGFMWAITQNAALEPFAFTLGIILPIAEISRRQFNQEPVSKSSDSPASRLRNIKDRIGDRSLSDSLQKFLSVAYELGHIESIHWAKLELNGYDQFGDMKEDDIVPAYREIKGRHFDRYGHELVIDDLSQSFINTVRLRFGVALLEQLAEKTQMQNIRNDKIISTIKENLNVEVEKFCFSPAELVPVISRIRTKLFEHLLELEKLCEVNDQFKNTNLRTA